MTKYLTFTISMLFVSCFSFSQTFFKIKAGMNLSKSVYLNKTNDNLVKPIRKLKPGIITGFVFQQFFNKILSVQAEILYSQKGLKTEQIPFATTYNTMNYIEIPISGQYSIMKTKHSYFNIYIGAYSAFWTDGKYKRKDYYTGEITSVKVDFHNPDYTYSRIDAGIFTGIIYNINNLDFFLRYTRSMTGSSELNADALTNRIFSFGINYIILK
ncbi:MAG: PorT family protein [Chlorobi bacterium]|nr:PorT family protein [Chlorobiota bacterium]